MRVFISWSGDRSHQLALALAKYLPRIIQRVRPWVSSSDIVKGVSWSSEIAQVLESTDVGILCVTKESIAAPWMLFEAGALSKKVGQSRVIPYLLDHDLGELRPPLSLLNSALCDEQDTLKVLRTLNITLGDGGRLDDTLLEDGFNVWWPKLDEEIQRLKRTTVVRRKPATEDQQFEDIKALIQAVLARLQTGKEASPREEFPTGAPTSATATTNGNERIKSYADEMKSIGVRFAAISRLLQGMTSDQPERQSLDAERHEQIVRAKEIQKRAARIGVQVELPIEIRLADAVSQTRST